MGEYGIIKSSDDCPPGEYIGDIYSQTGDQHISAAVMMLSSVIIMGPSLTKHRVSINSGGIPLIEQQLHVHSHQSKAWNSQF